MATVAATLSVWLTRRPPFLAVYAPFPVLSRYPSPRTPSFFSLSRSRRQLSYSFRVPRADVPRGRRYLPDEGLHQRQNSRATPRLAIPQVSAQWCHLLTVSATPVLIPTLVCSSTRSSLPPLHPGPARSLSVWRDSRMRRSVTRRAVAKWRVVLLCNTVPKPVSR